MASPDLTKLPIFNWHATKHVASRRDRLVNAICELAPDKVVSMLDVGAGDGTMTKLVADRRFGLKTPEQLVIDPLPSLKTALDKLPKGFTTSAQFSYGADSLEQRGVVTRLTAKPWAYILAVPIATYTKSADDATLNAMSMVVVGLLLSVVIGVLLTRSLVRPLRRLVGEATMVSTGDVDLRYASFDTRSGDDITREVASAFDRMLNAIRFYALSDDATAGED